MPSQNQPDPNQNQPQNTTPSVPFSPQADLPPLPPEFQNLPTQESTTPPATVTPADDSGSAAPPIPEFSNVTSAPKKKFGTKKIIATILGILLLIGGVGTGILLTQQQQLFNQKADVVYTCTTNTDACTPKWVQNHIICGTCDGDYVCGTWQGEMGVNQANCCAGGCSEDYPWNGTGGWCLSSTTSNKETCFHSATDCARVEPCSVTPPNPPNPQPPTTPSPLPPTTPPPSPVAPYCAAIKAYSADWTLLSASDLSALAIGAEIKFCVNGAAPSGTFDMAKFTINGVLQPETTTQRPSSTDFCQLYTITDNTITVSAQIHHATEGWF